MSARRGACPFAGPGTSWAVPRFSYALLGALALHGLTLLVRPRPARDTPLANAQPATQSFEVEEFPVEEVLAPDAPVEQVSPDALATRVESHSPNTAANHDPSPASKSAGAESPAILEAAPGSDTSAAPIAVASAEAGDGQPARKIDLGLDGHFFLHYSGPPNTAAPSPAAELGPRARKSTTQRQLENALSADDVQRGLARGNALLGSLSSAARSEGPTRGEAIFRATVAADGSFGSVELLRGTATEWSAVMSAFRQLAASKHVRLPPGAKGLRVTFSVKAKVQHPSGKDASESRIGAADPSLGPNGLIPSGDFDLADLGGGPQRLVYARVVSEEVL